MSEYFRIFFYFYFHHEFIIFLFQRGGGKGGGQSPLPSGYAPNKLLMGYLGQFLLIFTISTCSHTDAHPLATPQARA